MLVHNQKVTIYRFGLEDVYQIILRYNEQNEAIYAMLVDGQFPQEGLFRVQEDAMEELFPMIFPQKMVSKLQSANISALSIAPEL